MRFSRRRMKNTVMEEIYFASIYYCGQSDGLMVKKAGEKLERIKKTKHGTRPDASNPADNRLII